MLILWAPASLIHTWKYLVKLDCILISLLDKTFFWILLHTLHKPVSNLSSIHIKIFFCLSEIAADEIDEVDSIMEDITDEINDLQQSMNVSKVPCTINDENKINCNSTVYTGKYFEFDLFIFYVKICFY